MQGWTEQETADLKNWWGLGMSAGEIAERLGTKSRSAVVGKIQLIRANKSTPETEKPAMRRVSALGRLW